MEDLMSLPIEPDSGLFPDDAEPAFVRSSEVEDLATTVMQQWPEFEPIRTAISDGLEIAYVFETKPFDPLKDEYKRHVVARVSKASPLWQCLAEVRLAVQFRQWFWDKYSATQREAVLYHELKHIEVDLDSATPKVSLKPHEIEEFYGVARRYGGVLPDIANLVKVHSWWAQEQPGATLEPGRVIDQDTGEITEGTVAPLADILDTLSPKARAGVLSAARKFKRDIEAGGTDVTISTHIDGVSSEPVTIHGKRKP
jgi:Putative phage metallopeptidase